MRGAVFGEVDIEREARPDGSAVLRSRVPLGDHPRTLTERLLDWAERRGDEPFLARRTGTGPFRAVTYAETLRAVERLGQALLDRGLSVERPLAILCENGIEHGLLALAALHVGVPFAPVSPAYSLLSRDFGRLRHALSSLEPGLVLVSDGEAFDAAVAAAVRADVEVVVTGRPLRSRASLPFAELGAAPTQAVSAAHRAIDPDAVAKVLFTSGSTGSPKGVINTHRMLTSNLRQLVLSFPFLGEEPLVLVDWLPWHHTFGGNHDLGLVLESGGTLYIDEGKPTPELLATTISNLKEVAPTVYFNVPRGFAELLPHLERDEALRRRFFSRLRLLFFAGASLTQPVWDGLARLSMETRGRRVPVATGLGCTESSPAALFVQWEDARAGQVGVPVPGLEVKLAPVGDKVELRFRGPNITPGYFRQPEATAAAFDEEGFFRTGDAVREMDASDPNRGVVFDGRIAEDFKLSSGTWVSSGALRAAVLDACAPLVADAVLTGLDRDYVGAILFPSLAACARFAGLPPEAERADIVSHPAVRARVAEGLASLAAGKRGSAAVVARAVLTPVLPALDAGEATDKGSLNQRAVLRRRAAEVLALHAEPPEGDVIVVKVRSSQRSSE